MAFDRYAAVATTVFAALLATTSFAWGNTTSADERVSILVSEQVKARARRDAAAAEADALGAARAAGDLESVTREIAQLGKAVPVRSAAKSRSSVIVNNPPSAALLNPAPAVQRSDGFESWDVFKQFRVN